MPRTVSGFCVKDVVEDQAVCDDKVIGETIKLPVQMSSVAHDINLSRIIFGAISG